MSRRKPIRTRDDAERIAHRLWQDAEALFRAVGGDDSPIYRDEIEQLHELEAKARFAWQKLLRRAAPQEEQAE